MSVNGRINRLEEALGSYELFGGATAVDLSRFGYFNGDRELQETAPANVRQLAEASSLLVAISILTHREPEEGTAEVCEMLDLPNDPTADAILAAVMASAEQAGLRPKELGWLRSAARSRLRDLP